MMRQVVDIKEINVIPHDNILVVEGIHTSVNQVTGQPTQILLKVAIDRKKANVENLTFPIYIPVSNRNSRDHKKLLALFWSGEPFVVVSCKKLKVFRKREKPDDIWEYYGSAESFVVIDYDGGTIIC